MKFTFFELENDSFSLYQLYLYSFPYLERVSFLLTYSPALLQIVLSPWICLYL